MIQGGRGGDRGEREGREREGREREGREREGKERGKEREAQGLQIVIVS